MGDYISLDKLYELKTDRENLNKRITETENSIELLKGEFEDLNKELKRSIRETEKDNPKLLENMVKKQAEIDKQQQRLTAFSDQPYENILPMLEEVIDEFKAFSNDIHEKDIECGTRHDRAVETYNKTTEAEKAYRNNLEILQNQKYAEVEAIITDLGTEEQIMRLKGSKHMISGTHFFKQIYTYNMTMK